MIHRGSRRNQILASAFAVSLWFSAIPAAAQTGGMQYVAFGDSIAANPTWNDQFEKRPDAPCRTGMDSYPVHVAKQFQSSFNGSCSGAKIVTYPGERGTFSEELGQTIERATNEKAIGSSTKLITLTIGANDKWPHAQNFGYNPNGSRIAPEEYIQRIESHMKKLKELAPNARILLVGYPNFVGSDGKFCPINVDDRHLPVRMELPDPTLNNHFTQLNGAMAAAAKHFKVEYVDMTTAFEGHTTCAPEGQRWVTTIINNPGEVLLPMHISADGAKAQAHVIAEFLKQ